MALESSAKSAQVIDIFSGKMLEQGHDRHFVRLAPEFDGIGMLYSNDSNPGKLFNMKIIGWALQADGEVVGLVPWLNRIMACPQLRDPLNGHWEGYYDSATGDVFYEAPEHKILELSSTHEFYPAAELADDTIVQEIPDSIGTHAVMADYTNKKFIIDEVFSWCLSASGEIQAMLVDADKITETPVLTGDPCLYAAQQATNFKYFFQYKIANRIKENDPEALAAISHLIDF